MPLFIIILIIVLVLAGAGVMIYATTRIEKKENLVEHERKVLHHAFWSIVNSINWNDEEVE